MKKILAGLGIALAVALMSLGFVGSAHAADGYGGENPTDENVNPGTLDEGTQAGSSPSSGVLPSTGGPETVLLVGGAALLAVGGVALVASRRRARA